MLEWGRRVLCLICKQPCDVDGEKETQQHLLLLCYSCSCDSSLVCLCLCRKGSWLPLGAHRPPSPLIDGAKQKYENSDKLAGDFQRNLRCADLADVVFYVGQSMTPVYGVKAILACRSK